jgi:N-acetylneuraminate lyase
MSLRLIGLVAAPHTPLHADGSLALDVIERQAELLLATGVRGVFVCGTTGESHSLTLDERMRVAERWVAVAAGRFPVVVHVGHNCLADARTLAAHAQRTGADAIAAAAPCFFKPATVAELTDACAAVASAAPALPFYFYDIPGMTGVTVSAAALLERGSAYVPNLAGVKFTNGDLITLQECLALGDDFDVVFGYDELLLAGLALGVRGAVGSTYNFAAPLYQRLLTAFAASDLETARRLQRQSVALVRVLQCFGVVRAGKALMALLGIDCGPVRPPLAPMTAAEVAQLYEGVRHLDIFARPLQPPR